MAAARKGDRTSFGVLVERHWKTAVALALSRISDAAQAEDVAQESFIVAYTRLSTLRDPSRFAGWLSRIVLQRSVDHLRRRRRDPVDRNADLPAWELLDRPPADGALGEAQRRRVLEAVRRLPAKLQQVVVLRFIGGLSSAEIARQLGKRPGTVRVCLHRAYRRLREDLAALAEEVTCP